MYFLQDVDFTQNNLRGDLFETPLWVRLLDDLKNWNLHDIDSIKTVKQQAISGNLRKRKAHTITAFVETVDRSATDPLIIMRDTTGEYDYLYFLLLALLSKASLLLPPLSKIIYPN